MGHDPPFTPCPPPPHTHTPHCDGEKMIAIPSSWLPRTKVCPLPLCPPPPPQIKTQLSHCRMGTPSGSATAKPRGEGNLFHMIILHNRRKYFINGYSSSVKSALLLSRKQRLIGNSFLCLWISSKILIFKNSLIKKKTKTLYIIQYYLLFC